MCAAVPSWRPRATIESFCAEIVWPIERVTTACEASWMAITQRSASVRTWLFFAGPATTRSIASSRIACVIARLALAHGQQRGLVDHVRELGAA